MKLRKDGTVEAFDSLYTPHKENGVYKIFINTMKTKFLVMKKEDGSLRYVNDCRIRDEFLDLSFYGF